MVLLCVHSDDPLERDDGSDDDDDDDGKKKNDSDDNDNDNDDDDDDDDDAEELMRELQRIKRERMEEQSKKVPTHFVCVFI